MGGLPLIQNKMKDTTYLIDERKAYYFQPDQRVYGLPIIHKMELSEATKFRDDALKMVLDKNPEQYAYLSDGTNITFLNQYLHEGYKIPDKKQNIPLFKATKDSEDNLNIYMILVEPNHFPKRKLFNFYGHGNNKLISTQDNNKFCYVDHNSYNYIDTSVIQYGDVGTFPFLKTSFSIQKMSFSEAISFRNKILDITNYVAPDLYDDFLSFTSNTLKKQFPIEYNNIPQKYKKSRADDIALPFSENDLMKGQHSTEYLHSKEYNKGASLPAPIPR